MPPLYTLKPLAIPLDLNVWCKVGTRFTHTKEQLYINKLQRYYSVLLSIFLHNKNGGKPKHMTVRIQVYHTWWIVFLPLHPIKFTYDPIWIPLLNSQDICRNSVSVTYIFFNFLKVPFLEINTFFCFSKKVRNLIIQFNSSVV